MTIEQQNIEKQPMLLSDFIHSIGQLAKQGKWKAFREAVKKRKEWFDKFGGEKKF